MTDIASLFPDTVIRASAGTGKTYQLTNRYLGLLNCEEHADQILASTFARKAAGEILERVLIRLADASTDEKKRADLEDALNLGELTSARCASLLESLVRQIHRLRIETLDSFFFNTVGSFSLEFGLPGGWTILEELDDKAIRLDALRKLLERDSDDFASLLTLVTLLQKGEHSRDVLQSLVSTVTDFYNVSRELSPDAWRFLSPLPSLKEGEIASALELMRTVELPKHKSIATDHEQAIERFETEQWEPFLTKGIAAKILADENKVRGKPITDEVRAAYQPLIEHARAQLINKIAYQTEKTWELLRNYHEIYWPLKLERRGLRFDDVTHVLSQHLNEDRLPQIEYRLDTTIQHLMLDEFQDTSLPQWQVVRYFSAQANRQMAKSFFCVGDVKQAIYGWRGGESEIFDRITEEFVDVQQRQLTESFRSSQPVIDTVNSVFDTIHDNPSLHPRNDKEPDRLGDVRNQWRSRFEAHSTARTELHGHCTLTTYPTDDEGKCPRPLQFDVTAERIAELHKQHPGCSIAVLTRSNNAVAQLIYRLRNPKPGTREPVLASEEGGNPLTDSAAVIYLLSVLKLASHPGDLIARFNVAHSPLAKHLGVEPVHPRDWQTESFARGIRERLMREGYGKTIAGWVCELAPVCDARELDRLEQLVELAWRYESRATLDPLDFVSFVEETKIESPSSANVRVMTIHQSKGLQFDIVVLPELQGRILSGKEKYFVHREIATDPATGIVRSFPKDLVNMMPPQAQAVYETHCNRLVNEALSVLYVAMTRAVHALHMLVPPKPEHLTPAQMLIYALSERELEPDTELFSTGDPNWYEQHRENFERQAPQEKIVEAVSIKLASPNKKRKRNLEYVTPSRQGEKRMSLSRALDVSQSFSRLRGSLLHAWFEQVEWLEAGPPEEDVLREEAGRFLKQGLDLDEQLAQFQSALNDDEIADNLTESAYRDKIAPGLFPNLETQLKSGEVTFRVLREQRVTYRTETELVNGIADRIVLYELDGKTVAADVIDYKSDGATDQIQIDNLKQSYREQLSQYARGMRKLYQLDASSVITRLGLISCARFVVVK